MDNIDIDLQTIDVDNVDSVLTGPPGPPGYSPTATVVKQGGTATITITDENGTTTAQVSDGANGANGQDNSLVIGTVTSGAVASATITGTAPEQTLNLVLPKGDPGASGSDGSTPTVTVGTTYTVAPGTPASVTNVGTSTALILDFNIPQGIQGDSANCLSTPVVVDTLPEQGTPGTFYFVGKTYTQTNISGDNLTLTITDNSMMMSKFEILGELEQDTPPATPEPLTGVITVTINGEDYTIDLDTVRLAKVSTARDKIHNVDGVWYIHKEVGYISSYAGETITTAYVSTSGTLTNGDEVYYVLDEAEEIEVTDDSLFNSLTQVKNLIFTQTTTITTSADVTADLNIDYYSFDEHNQFDKYVYMVETSTYERI